VQLLYIHRGQLDTRIAAGDWFASYSSQHRYLQTGRRQIYLETQTTTYYPSSAFFSPEMDPKTVCHFLRIVNDLKIYNSMLSLQTPQKMYKSILKLNFAILTIKYAIKY
jgi:hypothetical protein